MRIQKEIENVERVKDKIATMPLTMEDAIEFHKQVVDRIEKERKEINKELSLDDDIEEKGFTGASKEPKKVSTPELKKMKLSESLFKSLNEELEDTDGWGDEIEYILDGIFSELENLMYEVRNCRRGSYTDCETADELAAYVHRLADDLDECSQEINANRNSINESLNEEVIPSDQDIIDFVENTFYFFWRNSRAVGRRPKEGSKAYKRDWKGVRELAITQASRKFGLPEEQIEEICKGSLINNESLNENLQDDLIKDVYNKLGDIAFNYHMKDKDPTKEEWQKALDRFMEKFFEFEDDESPEKDESPFGLNDSVDESLLTNDEYDYFTAYEVHNNYSKLYYEYPTYEEAKKDCLDGIKAAKDLGIKDIDKYTIYGVNQYGGDEFEETLVDTLYLDESLNECDKFKKGDCKNYALDEDWDDLIDDIDREDREKEQAEATQHMIDQQKKEAEEEERRAKEEAKRKERIGDDAWSEKDWIAEREKGDLDLSKYSDEEKAEIEKRLRNFDNDPTAQAKYKRKKEEEARKKEEEERKRAQQEKEEKIKQGIDTFGKAAKAPGELLNAVKKGLNIK